MIMLNGKHENGIQIMQQHRPQQMDHMETIKEITLRMLPHLKATWISMAINMIIRIIRTAMPWQSMM